MRLTEFLDKGVSLGAEVPCLTAAGRTLTYGDVQRLSWRIARALDRSEVGPGDKVAILSANDPIAFSCVFGISRAGAVWCPVNPRNEAAENRDLLDFFDCRCLIFQAAFAPLVAKILPDLPNLTILVCLDGEQPGAVPFDDWIGPEAAEPYQAESADDMVMLVGTGGTTGRPKGVMLTGHNIETMSALTLMSYPFLPRPRYLALAPLTHAAGVLCFPVLALGGEIVIMPKPDLAEFLALAERHRITHTFLPPTLIYMLLDHHDLPATDLTSLQCLWYGAAPMSASRQEALTKIGFNVYSAEVEQVILGHSAVQDCAVIGLPDEKWGERVTAVLQLRPGQTVTADEVRRYAKERLGSVKAPKQVEVWPDLPRSKVGKVLKTDVKARLQGEDQLGAPGRG